MTIAKILIVDDEPQNLLLLRAMLVRIGQNAPPGQEREPALRSGLR